MADFLLHPGETLSLLLKEPSGFLPLPAVQTPAAVLSGPPAEIRARTCLALGLRRQREPPSGADEHLVPTRARNGEPWASTSVGPGLRRPFAGPLGFDFLSYTMGSVVRPTSFSFFIFFLRQEHVNIIIFCFVLSRVPFLLISLSRIQDERPQPLVRCARRSGCRPGRARWGPGLLQGQHLGGRGACLGSDVLPTLITDFPRLCSHATRHPLILVLRDPGPSRILHMRGPPSPGRTAEELRGVRARGQPRSVPQPARPGPLPPVAARSKT